jgi:hypothetical protein
MQELLKTYPQLSQETLAFLARKHGHFINGRVEHGGSDEPIDIHDPATGLRIAQCSAGDAAEIDAAVKAARIGHGRSSRPRSAVWCYGRSLI